MEVVMKLSKWIINFTLIFLSLNFRSAISSSLPPTDVPPVDAPVIADVYFSRPLTVLDVADLASQGNYKVTMLEGSFHVGSETHYEFYPLSPDTSFSTSNAPIIENDIAQQRLDAMSIILRSSADLSDEERKSIEKELDAMQRAVNTHSAGPVLITKMRISGDSAAVGSVMADPSGRVSHVEITNPSAIQQKQIQNQHLNLNDLYLPSSQLVQPEVVNTWYPNSGRSETGQISPTERYTLQYMEWNAPVFSPDQTYEHDLFFYNYYGHTYLNGASTSWPECYPVAAYVYSSWPSAARPYLDTRLDESLVKCQTDELAFTIGAAQANALVAGKIYYNLFRTTLGNQSYDRFKLQAQIGQRIPTSCYTTWCSFAANITPLVPAWNTNVPGTVSWVK